MDAPSAIYSLVKYGSCDADFPAPLGEALGLTVHFDKPTISLVPGLLKASCPSAIGRPVIRLAFVAMTTRVMAVYINTIKRFIGRSFSHVGKKILVAVPATTHLDAPATVKRIKCVPTTTPGALPASVSWRFGFPTLLWKALVSFGELLSVDTSTTLGFAQLERRCVGNSGSAAFTLAKPENLGRFFPNTPVIESDYGQAPKFHTCNIGKSWARWVGRVNSVTHIGDSLSLRINKPAQCAMCASRQTSAVAYGRVKNKYSITLALRQMHWFGRNYYSAGHEFCQPVYYTCEVNQ